MKWHKTHVQKVANKIRAAKVIIHKFEQVFAYINLLDIEDIQNDVLYTCNIK